MSKNCEECGEKFGMFSLKNEVDGKTICSKCMNKINENKEEEMKNNLENMLVSTTPNLDGYIVEDGDSFRETGGNGSLSATCGQ